MRPTNEWTAPLSSSFGKVTFAHACCMGAGAQEKVWVPAALTASLMGASWSGMMAYPILQPPADAHLENPLVVMVPSG